MRSLTSPTHRWLLGLVVLSALGVFASGNRPASAHVAPSLDDNNRYIKLSLLGDRVRLVYTVFFGEVPGAAMRRELDKDRDGQLEGAETDAFARELGREVAGQLAITLDDKVAPVEFATVSFGSTTQLVRGGGAFSVDLIATLCMTEQGDTHRLRLRDRFRIPRPGETEVQLEDGPGITIERAELGAENDAENGAENRRAAKRMFRFAGVVPALAEPGLAVSFRVGAEAAKPAAGACERQAKRARGDASRDGLPLGGAIAGGAGLALLVGIASLLVWRRRRAAN